MTVTAEGATGRRVDLGDAATLLRRGRAVVDVDGAEVLLVRTGRTVHALRNVCPHLGLPLDDGRVSGRTIVCAAHGFRYDLRSGDRVSSWRCPAPSGERLPMLAVEVRDGRVLLTVPADGWSPEPDTDAGPTD